VFARLAGNVQFLSPHHLFRFLCRAANSEIDAT
jgi:hypothetical protein